MFTINHLHLMVSDIDRSTAFYTNIFGFSLNADYGPDLRFLRNKLGFDLALTPCEKVTPLPNGIHFGIGLNSLQDLEELYQLGHSEYKDLFDNKPADHGGWSSFTCNDPDGYIIEIYYDPNLLK